MVIEAHPPVADATATIRRYAPDAQFTAVENPLRFHCHSRVATTFRSERRPVAVRIAATGDAFERNQAMTKASDRADRDAQMQRTFADPAAAYLEAFAG